MERNTELKEIKEYIKDKRIAIIGNSQSLFDNKFGKEIDSYDVVIRLNKGFITNSEVQGTKTDILLLACELSTRQIKSFNPKFVINRTDTFTNPTIYQFDKEYIYNKSKKLNAIISSGLLMIEMCLDTGVKSIDLYGFDGGLTKTYYNPIDYITKHNYNNEAIRILDYVKDKKVTIHGNYIEPYIAETVRKYNFNVESLLKEDFKEYKVISFDVFDTLLIRPLLKPSDLFELIGGKEFYENRKQSERNTYAEGCHTFDEIYERVNPKFKHLKEIEINAELDICKPYEPVVKLFNHLKKLKKKIVITSDMYFSSDIIGKLLNKNGITGYEKIYVSSEYKKSKHNGKLYNCILEEYNIKPSELLHIGDNGFSDIENAEKLGIKTFQVDSINNKIMETDKKLSLLSDSLAINYWIFNTHRIFKKMSYWEYIGYVYGSLFAYGFMYFVKDIVDKHGYDSLLFAGRDGYILKQVYEKIGGKGKTIYAYANRKMHYSGKDYSYYFNNIGLGKKPLLIDITTLGFSAQLVSKIKDAAYYWQRVTEPKGYKCYTIAHLTEHTRIMSWELIETIIASPEPTVKDIGTDLKPIYNPITEEEEYRIKIIKEINKGIMEADYSNLIRFKESDFVEIINNFLKNLSKEDMEELGKVKFSDDVAHDKYKSLLKYI